MMFMILLALFITCKSRSLFYYRYSFLKIENFLLHIIFLFRIMHFLSWTYAVFTGDKYERKYSNKKTFIFACQLVSVNIFPRAPTNRGKIFQTRASILFFVHYIISSSPANAVATLLPVGGVRVQACRVNRGTSTNSTYVIAMHGSLFQRFYDSPAFTAAKISA